MTAAVTARGRTPALSGILEASRSMGFPRFYARVIFLIYSASRGSGSYLLTHLPIPCVPQPA